jgi:hypothetical protein
MSTGKAPPGGVSSVIPSDGGSLARYSNMDISDRVRVITGGRGPKWAAFDVLRVEVDIEWDLGRPTELGRGTKPLDE